MLYNSKVTMEEDASIMLIPRSYHLKYAYFFSKQLYFLLLEYIGFGLLSAGALCRSSHVQDSQRRADIRILAHAGGSPVHAHGRSHLRHPDSERVGGERSIGRCCFARRGRNLHRKVLHRNRSSPG